MGFVVDYGIPLSYQPASLCGQRADTITLCQSRLYPPSQGLRIWLLDESENCSGTVSTSHGLHDELSLHVCVKNREKLVFYFWNHRRGSVRTEALTPKNIEWFIEDQAFLRSSDSALPHLSRQQVVFLPFSVFLCATGRAYWRERGGGGGRGAISYDHEKTWPSIYHSKPSG
jgi:hypothetical protein